MMSVNACHCKHHISTAGKAYATALTKMGCSDLILDTLVDTAKMSRNPNVKYKQRKKNYDSTGKLIRKEKGYYLI